MSERAVRWRWNAAAAGAVAAVVVVAVAAGWDVGAWLAAAWDGFMSVSLVYLVPALALQTLQTLFAAAAWHGILRYAYQLLDCSRGDHACKRRGRNDRDEHQHGDERPCVRGRDAVQRRAGRVAGKNAQVADLVVGMTQAGQDVRVPVREDQACTFPKAPPDQKSPVVPPGRRRPRGAPAFE